MTAKYIDTSRSRSRSRSRSSSSSSSSSKRHGNRTWMVEAEVVQQHQSHVRRCVWLAVAYTTTACCMWGWLPSPSSSAQETKGWMDGWMDGGCRAGGRADGLGAPALISFEERAVWTYDGRR